MEFLPTVVTRACHTLQKTWPVKSTETPKSESQEPTHPTSSTKINLDALTSPSDLSLLPTIEYAYDPLPTHPPPSSLILPINQSNPNSHTTLNSIPIDPLAAGLPYRSRLNHVRASKHWTANLASTIKLLDLLAEDDSAADIEVLRGTTLTKLAKQALKPGKQQQMTLATHYMFPGASAERIQQIAALTILYFVFDDKVEETPNEKLRFFRDDFIRRLDGGRRNRQNTTTTTNTTTNNNGNDDKPPSPLQSHIDALIHSIETSDTQAGATSGREMIDALKSAFHCVHPPNKGEGGFDSISSYLDFRRRNIGADFVIAAAKHSISSVLPASLTSPTTPPSSSSKFSHILHLLSTHMCIINDLFSYDKELRALTRGDTDDMINLIDVIKRVNGLVRVEDAKDVAWMLLGQVERGIIDEWERLLEAGEEKEGLSEEERWFLEAVVMAATGNVMFCVTTGRYGGEAARI